MKRNSLLTYLNKYVAIDDPETEMLHTTIQFVTNNPDCFERSLAVGHITASGWVVDGSREQALLMHHRKLDRWFQPGGHCDGDSEVIQVAKKEVEEETGIHGQLVFDGIFDVDIHTIPANSKEAEHLHYDIRFLFEADPKQPLLINEEFQSLKWINLIEIEKYNHSDSILRMVRKAIALQTFL
jgi:8-oxo-dGTP pyrophosphatase MutT (NUDIX family)